MSIEVDRKLQRLGISQSTEISGLSSSRKHSGYADVWQVEVQDDQFALFIVEELSARVGPERRTLLTAFKTATESPRSWYQTGNPFRIEERWGILVRKDTVSRGSLQKAHVPFIDAIVEQLGAPIAVPTSFPATTLPEYYSVPRRWITAEWRQVKEAVQDLISVNEVIEVKSPQALPKQEKSKYIYLNIAHDLPGFVKFGMADENHFDRLFAQQLCNPRVLGHLAVWDVSASSTPLRSIEGELKAVLKKVSRGTTEGGAEWLRIEWSTALQVGMDLAACRGWVQKI